MPDTFHARSLRVRQQTTQELTGSATGQSRRRSRPARDQRHRDRLGLVTPPHLRRPRPDAGRGLLTESITNGRVESRSLSGDERPHRSPPSPELPTRPNRRPSLHPAPFRRHPGRPGESNEPATCTPLGVARGARSDARLKRGLRHVRGCWTHPRSREPCGRHPPHHADGPSSWSTDLGSTSNCGPVWLAGITNPANWAWTVPRRDWSPRTGSRPPASTEPGHRPHPRPGPPRRCERADVGARWSEGSRPSSRGAGGGALTGRGAWSHAT